MRAPARPGGPGSLDAATAAVAGPGQRSGPCAPESAPAPAAALHASQPTPSRGRRSRRRARGRAPARRPGPEGEGRRRRRRRRAGSVPFARRFGSPSFAKACISRPARGPTALGRPKSLARPHPPEARPVAPPPPEACAPAMARRAARLSPGHVGAVWPPSARALFGLPAAGPAARRVRVAVSESGRVRAAGWTARAVVSCGLLRLLLTPPQRCRWLRRRRPSADVPTRPTRSSRTSMRPTGGLGPLASESPFRVPFPSPLSCTDRRACP